MDIGYTDIDQALFAARKLELEECDVVVYYNPGHPSGYPYQVEYQNKF